MSSASTTNIETLNTNYSHLLMSDDLSLSFKNEMKSLIIKSSSRALNLFSRDSYYMKKPCLQILCDIKLKAENNCYNTIEEYFQDVQSLRITASNYHDFEAYKVSEHMLIALKSDLTLSICNRLNRRIHEKNFNENNGIDDRQDYKNILEQENDNRFNIKNPLQQLNSDDIERGDVIGYGSFAVVFKGTFRCCPVAIKCLSSKVSGEDFAKEVLLMSNIRHPGFVQYLGYCLEEKWIVMEWMENGSLFNYLHDNPSQLPLTTMIDIAKDVACAMEYLHSLNLRHCDLNSKNLLIDKNMRVKISDLGLTQEIDECSQTNKKIGTLRWMSPEMISRKCMSMEKSDVYSYGIIMFELFTGKIPYEEYDDMDVKQMILKGVRPSIKNTKIFQQYPLLKELLLECTNTDYLKRPKFRDIYQRLIEIFDDEI